MHAWSRSSALVLIAGSSVACTGDSPIASSDEPALAHAHATVESPEFRKKMAELRRWSAPFHNPDKAAAAGYTGNIGCIDETVNGVDPATARGMGYHVTRGDVDLINDGVVNIDEPEFLVYAPHENDAALPRSERLAAARLVAFDYYIPAASWQGAEPPEFLGEPFHWSNAFQGWIRHYWLFGHNPDGITADFNPDVGLCTELLTP